MSAPAAQAAIIYVATNGNDSTANGSTNAPYKTIMAAYKQAKPGDTVMVRPGTYTTVGGYMLQSNGTASAPITIKSEVQGGATIDMSNSRNPYHAILVLGNYNIIDGFKVTRGGVEGFAIYGNGDQILNNEIFHNGNTGPNDKIDNGGYNGISTRQGSNATVISGNYIHDNGRPDSNHDHGIYMMGDNGVVTNNVVTHNATHGIQIAGRYTLTHATIENNVFSPEREKRRRILDGDGWS